MQGYVLDTDYTVLNKGKKTPHETKNKLHILHVRCHWVLSRKGNRKRGGGCNFTQASLKSDMLVKTWRRWESTDGYLKGSKCWFESQPACHETYLPYQRQISLQQRQGLQRNHQSRLDDLGDTKASSVGGNHTEIEIVRQDYLTKPKRPITDSTVRSRVPSGQQGGYMWVSARWTCMHCYSLPSPSSNASYMPG